MLQIKTHYPYQTDVTGRPKGNRTLCDRGVGREKTDDNETSHMFTIYPEELNCGKCKRLARNSGLIRYFNSHGGV